MKPFALALLFAVAGLAQIPTRTRMFIAPMQGNLDGFIAAEIIKKHLPIAVVNDERLADCIMVGLSLDVDDRWYYAILGTEKDRTEGNIRVFDIRTHQMLWAAEAGDRTLLWFPSWRRGHRRRVADRIVRNIRDKGLAVATATGTAGNGTSGPGYHLENARQ